MSNADTKGERLLKTLAQTTSCELTEEGRRYVIQRFDPFHDKPMKPVGYPDNYNGHSVARCIKKSKTVSLTTGGAPTQTTPWDLNVTITPLASPDGFIQTTTRLNSTYTFLNTPIAEGNWGGVCITGNSASGSNFTYPATVLSGLNLGQLFLTDEDLTDNMRITSIGLEVQDMTAELYQQGLITVFRQNQQQPTTTTWSGWATTGVPPGSAKCMTGSGAIIKLPPISVEHALLMPDTKQWKVREGAYLVADFNSDQIPMEPPQWVMPVLVNDRSEVTLDGDIYNVLVPYPGSGLDHVSSGPMTWTVMPPTPNRFLPINQSGIFLSGLNPQATINISVIWYVECAPGSEDQELLSLCSQSPSYDPIAMKIVSALRRDSPIGVKYRENYTGQWFFDGIKGIVQKALPWLDNASIVGKQAIKWIDSASTNDGYINPQSFVRGDVATKVSKEKNPVPKKAGDTRYDQALFKSGVPRPPGPAPKKRAFAPKPVARTKKGNVRYFDDTEDNRRRRKKAIAYKAARGDFVRGTQQRRA